MKPDLEWFIRLLAFSPFGIISCGMDPVKLLPPAAGATGSPKNPAKPSDFHEVSP